MRNNGFKHSRVTKLNLSLQCEVSLLKKRIDELRNDNEILFRENEIYKEVFEILKIKNTKEEK